MKFMKKNHLKVIMVLKDNFNNSKNLSEFIIIRMCLLQLNFSLLQKQYIVNIKFIINIKFIKVYSQNHNS